MVLTIQEKTDIFLKVARKMELKGPVNFDKLEIKAIATKVEPEILLFITNIKKKFSVKEKGLTNGIILDFLIETAQKVKTR